jgi:hypothetical protein
MLRLTRALTPVLFAVVATACTDGSPDVAASPTIVDEQIALSPSTASLEIGFLSGQLQDLKVVRRVEEGSGRVIDKAELRGTLLLKNVSTDRAAHVLNGRVEYVDGDGKPIALAEGREEPEIEFYSYGGDRLDPGEETTQTFDVPFPSAALAPGRLGDVRVQLTFIPSPYRTETGTVSVSLGE